MSRRAGRSATPPSTASSRSPPTRDAFGLERLYEICRIARRLCDPLRIGRVIARPFVGTAAGGFARTAHRQDFAVAPPGDTLLDILTRAGREVATIGKIGDIFAHRGTGREVKAPDNDGCLSAALTAFATLRDGGFVFANLVDFDSEFGHRRDVAGYANALERLDRRVPEIRAALRPGDLAVITADHGNDPTFRGYDHTRESVPILAFGPGLRPGPLGRRPTLADIGATLADHLGVGAAGRRPLLGRGGLDRLAAHQSRRGPGRTGRLLGEGPLRKSGAVDEAEAEIPARIGAAARRSRTGG